MGQKEPPRLGSKIYYGQTWARKNLQDSAVRFVVTAKNGPERATETRQHDLLRPRVGQKESSRLGSTICYCQTSARKSHQDSAVRFVTASHGPQRPFDTRQYDLLRPNVGQNEPPRLTGPERSTETLQYDLLRPNVGQKEPPRLGSTICYGQSWATKTLRHSVVQFATAKPGPERATKAQQYDLLRPNVGQKEPLRLGSTICYGQMWARKSQRDSAVLFATAKTWPERAIETRHHKLLQPNVGQKKPLRLGSTICYDQTWARKSHRDSAVRFVRAKHGPERATETRLYDLILRPRKNQKEPPRLGSKICYSQTWARKNHGSTICHCQMWARKSY